MDWQFIGVLAEMISAVAVVVTLIFLAVEVRNNRNATQSNSLDALAAGFSDINYNVIGDSEFASIWEKGLAAPETLSSQEVIRISMYMQCYVNHYTALRKYHELGVLPDEEWDAYLAAFSGIVHSVGGQWLVPRLAIAPSLLREIQDYGPPEQKYGWVPQAAHPPDNSLEPDASDV